MAITIKFARYLFHCVHIFSESKHIKQGSFMGMLRSTWKAMKVQAWQGDIKQQGGAFIFGPGNVDFLRSMF